MMRIMVTQSSEERIISIGIRPDRFLYTYNRIAIPPPSYSPTTFSLFEGKKVGCCASAAFFVKQIMSIFAPRKFNRKIPCK